jgi:site-specific DNA recombinase
MRCVIYCRVSTDAQERDGTSLDTQERACIEFASNAGWNVVETIRDAASGFSLDRPGLEHVREMMNARLTDVVLTFAVDRLSRNQNHIGVLFDEANGSNVRLDFVTEKFEDTAVGRFILAARAFVAEVEREKIVERTQRGKAQRAREGKLPQATGRGMYGYRYDAASGTRQIDPAEAATVRTVFSRFADGASCHGLACELNDAGVRAFKGGQWYPLTIRRMLLNETYTGRTIYRRTKAEKYRDSRTGRTKRTISIRDESEWIEVSGATPAIVTAELFERVNAILTAPERRNRNRPSRRYPLRGRLRCAVCGAPMVGQSLQKGAYSYYRCRHSYGNRWQRHCDSRYIRSESLENAVRQALADLLSDPARVLAEARHLQNSKAPTRELAAVTKALEEVEARQRRLVRLFTDGGLPQELLEEQREALSRERRELEERRQRLEAQQGSIIDLSAIKGRMPTVLAAIREWTERADADQLDLMLEAVSAEIMAQSGSVTISGSIPMIESEMGQNLVTIERTSA